MKEITAHDVAAGLESYRAAAGRTYRFASAVTDEEWERGVDVGVGLVSLRLDPSPSHATGDTEADGLGPPYLVAHWNTVEKEQTLTRLPAIIALANAALPETDRHKLTHRHVAMLRDAARIAEEEGNTFDDLLALADVLESYLPPEEE